MEKAIRDVLPFRMIRVIIPGCALWEGICIKDVRE
jgi:hypothetical protein